MARRQNPYQTRAFVGKQRISANTDPKRADALRSYRAQMQDILRAYDMLVNQLQDLSVHAAYQSASKVLARAQHYVPKDTYKLHDSGYCEVTEDARSAGRVNVQVGFAKGDNPDYAVIVHEDLTKTHAPPTQAKFLSQAIADQLHTMLQDAGKVIGEPFGGANV